VDRQDERLPERRDAGVQTAVRVDLDRGADAHATGIGVAPGPFLSDDGPIATSEKNAYCSRPSIPPATGTIDPVT
jgi:hypothetical protein